MQKGFDEHFWFLSFLGKVHVGFLHNVIYIKIETFQLTIHCSILGKKKDK